MEKTSNYASSDHRSLCVVVFSVIAIFTMNVLFVLFYTNTQVVKINERFGKMESKLDVLDMYIVEDESLEMNQRNGSSFVLQHREKRNAPITLNEVSKRLKTLENRLNTALNKKLQDNNWLLPLLKGRDGRDGRDGTMGPPGPPGKIGPRGARGISGKIGLQGTRGEKGQKGDKGLDGSTKIKKGPAGPPGAKGEKGGPGPKGDQGIKPTVGTYYVRWGRTRCPVGANLVYQGRIGGSHYTHTGGGANYLCLSNNPTYATYHKGTQGWSYIYGSEYEGSGFTGFGRNLLHHDAPCAVCYVSSRGSQLMYPARNDCPPNWTREYWGYLSSGHYGHKHSTEFICVDRNAESVPGSSSGQHGVLLYPTQGICGSLPCPPYVSGRELTCAVCTK